MHPQEEILKHGALSINLNFDAKQYTQLLDYIDALLKWNRVYNVSAAQTPNAVAIKHILDCLAVVPPLRAYTGKKAVRLLDVGSGAGLPGAVLAVACPEITVCCIDANAKKSAFVQQLAGRLALNNLQSRHIRVQDVRDSYDVVTSRAFSSLENFCVLSQHVLAQRGVWLAMKGKRPDMEISALSSFVEVFHVEHLNVPRLDAERCLVWMRRVSA